MGKGGSRDRGGGRGGNRGSGSGGGRNGGGGWWKGKHRVTEIGAEGEAAAAAAERGGRERQPGCT